MINFAAIPKLRLGMSGRQRRILNIAASLGGTTPIILADEVAGLDRIWIELVSIAIVHAAGFAKFTTDLLIEDDTPVIVRVPPRCHGSSAGRYGDV